MPTKSTDFPKDLAKAMRQYGVREGHSHRETDPDYRMVLDVPDTGPNDRLAVCKHGIQIIHQRKASGRWRNTSFYASESGLKRVLSAIYVSHEGSHSDDDMTLQPEVLEGPKVNGSANPEVRESPDERRRSNGDRMASRKNPTNVNTGCAKGVPTRVQLNGIMQENSQ